MGFTGLLHVDYQNWVGKKTSIEIGLTPLLLHNVLLVAANHRIGQSNYNKNPIVSGAYLGITNMGFTFNGVGGRVGWEALGEEVGFSIVGGPFVGVGDGSFRPLVDVRVTAWGVHR